MWLFTLKAPFKQRFSMTKKFNNLEINFMKNFQYYGLLGTLFVLFGKSPWFQVVGIVLIFLSTLFVFLDS